jgi:NAD(P)-dependent dehydrogenase (short-subunit alcohol dehydrogenase family)
VFANAGIAEKTPFYATKTTGIDDTPLPANILPLKIDLEAVIQTVHLAMHFMRKNEGRSGGNIIINSSTAGFYATPSIPIYAAAKHGCVGFMRSLAPVLLEDDIRVNSTNPSVIKTGLMSEAGWATFPHHLYTPIESLVSAVNRILGDDTIQGQAVEVIMDRHYFRGKDSGAGLEFSPTRG